MTTTNKQANTQTINTVGIEPTNKKLCTIKDGEYVFNTGHDGLNILLSKIFNYDEFGRKQRVTGVRV